MQKRSQTIDSGEEKAKSPHTVHVPVLLHEVIRELKPEPGEVVLDATLGGGGHARALADAIGNTGVLIGLDADCGALRRARRTLTGTRAKVHLAEANFRNVHEVLHTLGIDRVDKVLMDLGLSRDQLESVGMKEGRGFSFLRDEPLLMTFAEAPEEGTTTAHDLVNYASSERLADVLFSCGEERRARTIAKAIVHARETDGLILTSARLAQIIAHAAPQRGKTHPATKTFQALRIAVNDELGALTTGLTEIWTLLAEGSRLAVITFHSLEDRIVKQTFRAWAEAGKGDIRTKRPIVPSREEVRENSASRSAKLRVFEKHTQT